MDNYEKVLKYLFLFYQTVLKGLITYRTDFLVRMLAFCLTKSRALFLYVVFDNIDALAGFSQYEVSWCTASANSKGIDHLIFDNIWLCPQIRRNIDRYLLRPINPLFPFGGTFQPDAFGEIIQELPFQHITFFGGITFFIKILGLTAMF